MKYLKLMALVTVLMIPMAYSQAQVRVGVGIGVGPVGVAVGAPPVCAYGYYNYYPYACAPYGFYGPNYFVNGVFIGVGPWYHWGHPAWFWNRAYVGRGGWYGRPGWGYGRPGYGYRPGPAVRAYDHGYARGYVHGAEHANVVHGGGFHGGGGFRGGRR